MFGIVFGVFLAILALGMLSTIAPRDRKNPTLMGGVAILLFMAAASFAMGVASL